MLLCITIAVHWPIKLHFLNYTYLFILPSAVDSPTLPIALSRTVFAAQDMDHHSPVMV